MCVQGRPGIIKIHPRTAAKKKGNKQPEEKVAGLLIRAGASVNMLTVVSSGAAIAQGPLVWALLTDHVWGHVTTYIPVHKSPSTYTWSEDLHANFRFKKPARKESERNKVGKHSCV